MKLTLPLPPNAANARRHWRVALRDKKAYWERLTLLWAKGEIPRPRVLDPERVRVTAHFYVHNRMDIDNAFARLKPAMDWLSSYGYLKDDGPEHLEWASIPEQSIDRKDPRIELTLEAA